MTSFSRTVKLTLIVMVLVLFSLGLADARSLVWAGGNIQGWLNRLATLNPSTAGASRELPLAALGRFYELVGHRPVWVDADGLSADGKAVRMAMANAADNGLDPEDYVVKEAAAPWAYPASHDRAAAGACDFDHRLIQWDVVLTSQVIQYATHLSSGRIAPDTLDDVWISNQPATERDLPAELAAAVLDHRLSQFFESLPPDQSAYARLASSLKRLGRIQASGGWPTVAPGPSLRRGDRSPRVPDLRRRLHVSGDLNGFSPTDETLYDRSLEAAVMRFQHRHGLATDGVAGKLTVAALAVPVDARIRQLQLNMERWRWYPRGLGPHHLLVNIPDYTLRIVKDGWVIRQMRAIVGRPKRQTPILTGRMTYMDLNPYWNIPRKIAREDILPKILEDTAYLDRQGIQVLAGWQPDSRPIDPWSIDWNQISRARFPYRLRQDPSPLNALGRIKFVFPNRHSIYIHDTPGKSLFSRAQRSFSAGCIRVDRPMELAAYLLKEQGWHPSRLETAVASGRQQAVILRQPVDVFLAYFTAWVDGAGKVHFRNDVYGRDRSLQLAIDQRSGPQLRYPFVGPR